MKVFVSVPQNHRVRKSFFKKEVEEYLEERFEVTYSPLDRQLEPEEIAEYAKDAEVIMTGWGHPMITGKALENTKIKLIVHIGGSVADYVNDEVYEKSVRVISGNELFAESVAEGTIAYMMLALRKMPDYVEDMRQGNWKSDVCPPTEGILDQTIGIIGVGAISRILIQMLKPFRVRLKLYSGYPIDEEFLKEHNAVQTSLEDIFATCKIVSLHSSLTERTKGMIGKEHFDLLQDGAVFVNTARGAIIREDEMIEALKENRFRAVLDVYCQEPLDVNSPLRTMKNVYCMPHKGGPTSDRAAMITMRLADEVVHFAEGKAIKYEISNEYAKRMTKQRS